MQLHYLETGSCDPRYNLAFEEYVLRERREGDWLLLWQNDRTVVVGRNQNAEAEIHRPFVESHGIQVVRRSTGGGAVFHDLGNLNYSFITDAERPFTPPVAEALQALGLRAEATGRNDILVEGRKVSGTARQVLGRRLLFHGTLLFDTDLDMAAGALRADPEKFRSKGIASVRSRIGNIRDFLPRDMDLKAFWDHLKVYLTGKDMAPDTLSPEELEAVLRLKEEKYDQWDWTFGRSPRFDVVHKRRWEGGSLEVCLSVSEGRIREACFYGDFLSLEPPEAVAAALKGCRFCREDVSEILDRFRLEHCFGQLRKEEILDTIFSAC